MEKINKNSRAFLEQRLEELRNKEQELSDEQGYWGDESLLAEIELIEAILGEEWCNYDTKI